MRTRDAIAQAKRDGRAAGLNAAAWCIDGNTSDATCKAIADGLDSGDPAILDRFNVPNLSGEWADSPTPHSLASEYGIDAERRADALDEVCSAWENAASDAFWMELERLTKLQTA